jgi:hypothetical protein
LDWRVEHVIEWREVGVHHDHDHDLLSPMQCDASKANPKKKQLSITYYYSKRWFSEPELWIWGT